MDLFDNGEAGAPWREDLAEGAAVLHGYAWPLESALLEGVARVSAQAPFRHMETPGGLKMSAAMTSCGRVGWISDQRGYRYSPADPATGKPWPAMPPAFLDLASRAAAELGFDDFKPDTCLINRYAPGAKMSLHQDKNERDMAWPIVSVSLGLPATFLFGGFERTDAVVRTRLGHGDVAVWGGPARLRYHGVQPIAAGVHGKTGACRINLTFRKAC